MVQLKEGLINIASIYSLCAPIALILYLQEWRIIIGIWVIIMGIALAVPPRGWMRPHPYSDVAWNR